MSKKILVLLLVIGSVSAGGFLWWRNAEQEAATDPLTLYGNIDIREAQLAFAETEHIEAILVQEGDRVAKGQVLARLHHARLEHVVVEAEATVAAQEQMVARLEAGSRPEEIAQVRAEAAAAAAEAESARATYERQRKMLEQAVTSPETAEVARAAARSATARTKAAEAALALILAGPRQEDIAQARAELEARRAALGLARERLADTVLAAPADGVVRDRLLEPGDMASPQKPVFTLALTDPVWVRAWLPEPALGKIAPGMKAEIHTDSYPDKRYAGWVGYISPSAEFTPKNVESPELRTRLVYQMRVFATNPDGELRLGMPVTVTIALGQQGTGPPPAGNPP
jgi:HlyD family secretion protein